MEAELVYCTITESMKEESQDDEDIAESNASGEENYVVKQKEIQSGGQNVTINREEEDLIEEESCVVNPTTNSIVFACTKCNTTYTSPFYLQKHQEFCQRTKMPTRNVKPRGVRCLIKTIDGVKTFCCKICDYTAHTSRNIRRHLEEHTEVKTFKCKVCDKAFPDLSHLTRHRRTHRENNRRHKCSECDKAFSRGFDLKRHATLHTGEKIYACTVCEYTTSQNTSLKCHMRVHTGEKPYGCTLCEYEAKERTALRLHVRAKHTGERPYACVQCEYRSAVKSSLNAHVKRMHPGEST